MTSGSAWPGGRAAFRLAAVDHAGVVTFHPLDEFRKLAETAAGQRPQV